MMSIIFGSNGKGKSSLQAHFLNESAFDYARIRQGVREVKELEAQFNVKIPIPQHFTYLNGTAVFRKAYNTRRQNLYLDPGRLGIQSEAPEGVKCQFILPYATLGIDEAQTWFSSRDGHVENYQFSFFEKHRHNNLNIIMTTTRAMLIDKRIRDLSEGFFIKDRQITIRKDGSMLVDWYVDHIPVGSIDAYLSVKPSEQRHYRSREKITADYNVFDLYDPEGCKYLFYQGYEGRDFYSKYGEL